MLRLYNTLTREKEVFKPLNKNEVSFYACGPTVYGPGHLGHARSYTNFDLLRRVLEYNGYKVKHIMNITDIHDDMIRRANELGVTIFELADQYIPPFKKELCDLNIISPDSFLRVTEHIPQIIDMIKVLVEKRYGYVEKDGSVYYDVSMFKDYGKLSGVKLDQAKTGTRVETDKYEKENVADFVLWKGWKEGEPYWESPWGKGRPGWHIECSVMAKKYLGETIDIHAGAMDLKFPHHENEIAQSEAANGIKFVNYWVHGGLLEIGGQKMSKSLGNYIEICKVKEKGFDLLALRYLFLTGHYRSKMNFTWEALEGAQNSLDKLYSRVREMKNEKGCSGNCQSCFAHALEGAESPSAGDYKKRFLEKINNDMAMPEALAIVWEMVKDNDLDQGEKYELLLDFDRVLGLGFDRIGLFKIPDEIQKLVDEREGYRQSNDFKKADELRKKIEKMGFEIEDTEGGARISEQ